MFTSQGLSPANRNRPSGFSRLNLLAVIVIIGILVALLLPAVLARARRLAETNA